MPERRHFRFAAGVSRCGEQVLLFEMQGTINTGSAGGAMTSALQEFA